MPTMAVMELAFILIIIGALALLIVPRYLKRGPKNAEDSARGELLITGVSPRPDGAVGEQYVTISGVIKGPTVREHVVYQQMAVDAEDWPTIGQLLPVDYSMKNPDNWRFAGPEEPPAPELARDE